MIFAICRYALPLLLTIPLLTRAISLDINDESSIRDAARTIAKDLLSYYEGDKPGKSIGLFPEEYYFIGSGAVWSGLIDYWAYTGDDQYNNLIQEALAFQVGPINEYMPLNQTKTEGNDDQGVWALAAMSAAEHGLPKSDSPSWLDLAKNVFDRQVARWDAETCEGGLRWQIFSFNTGYDYKNSASNGIFFQLAARLGAFTGNQTYIDWAAKSYEWTKSVGLVNEAFNVFDGVHITEDCSGINKVRWTYSAATFVYGSAVLYNHTKNLTWQDTSNSFITASDVFFERDGVMTEQACEPYETCDPLIPVLKGLAAQWFGATMRVAPYTVPSLSNKIRLSARAAAKQCSGGKDNKTACGLDWTITTSDGNYGMGQELSAMNVIVANLRGKSAGTSDTTSSSNSTSAASSAASSTAITSEQSTTAASDAEGNSSGSTARPATPSQAIGSGSVKSRKHVAGSCGLYTVLAVTLCLMTA